MGAVLPINGTKTGAFWWLSRTTSLCLFPGLTLVKISDMSIFLCKLLNYMICCYKRPIVLKFPFKYIMKLSSHILTCLRKSIYQLYIDALVVDIYIHIYNIDSLKNS